MHIAVSGSTGLIGSALVRSLLADGHTVTRLVRRAPRAAGDGTAEAEWRPADGWVDLDALDGIDGVVNLAGAPIAGRRWTESYKQQLRDSRIDGTATLARAAGELGAAVLVNGSAIGWYGDNGARILDESAPAGSGFLSRLCVDWEAATAPAEKAGVRVVLARSGIVVSRHGGAFQRLLPLFKAGLGGRLGSGMQYWSWVSLRDEVAALRFLLEHAEVSGPVNVTGPEPVTNREMTAVLGRLLGRPTLAAAPAFALRAVLGEVSSDLLASERVVPGVLQRVGFGFADGTVRSALEWALAAD
ncbi:TIGR01777 family protein [Mangrovactinospora gilvigrisea]|uniref:TIGR01777 family protein n=1 Tax=Mangrovactinospora gilvigrisea TaxID=1428644 RepID=A0A1J7BC94_9ACTN|nr:TIGR01777 family oxidoreductase [Mangrovactinospora gilvigrisea]OIV36262.1 TIGR01777 family protein [Mangrovactinospora gilvigrisea]